MSTLPTTLRWEGDVGGWLVLLDQTRLPGAVVYRECRSLEDLWESIRMLRVRGAPAIGIAAAYGVCLGLQPYRDADRGELLTKLEAVIARLAECRPTAVNLAWALERMRGRAEQESEDLLAALLDEARVMHQQDREICRAIGRHGAKLLPQGAGVLTHCNAGGLATSEYGTALAVIYAAHEQGRCPHVYVDETRPLLQGSRLTAWELMQHGVDATLICDSMAAEVMREGRVQVAVTGADRIAANGDTANKIGTYGVALAAAAHGIPFYIAAPISTFDLSLASGDGIPIEQRSADEVTHGLGTATAPAGVRVYNPAFDVTPAKLIRGIVCERGVIAPVTPERIAEVVA